MSLKEHIGRGSLWFVMVRSPVVVRCFGNNFELSKFKNADGLVEARTSSPVRLYFDRSPFGSFFIPFQLPSH